MATSKATVKNLSMSARKVRLVADLIRGKKVEDARYILQFNKRHSSEPLLKLVNSAAANAEHLATERGERVDADEWVVSEIMVNEGRTLHRFQPTARGRAGRIRKRSSHVQLQLSAKK